MPYRYYCGGRYIEGEDGYPLLKDPVANYDIKEHMYIFTKSGCIAYTGFDPEEEFGSVAKAAQNIKEITRQVYREAYKGQDRIRTKRVTEFIISKTEEGREGILRAIAEQIKFAIRTGKDLKGEIIDSVYDELRDHGLYNPGGFEFDVRIEDRRKDY